jgi:hypothetical protein
VQPSPVADRLHLFFNFTHFLTAVDDQTYSLRLHILFDGPAGCVLSTECILDLPALRVTMVSTVAAIRPADAVDDVVVALEKDRWLQGLVKKAKHPKVRSGCLTCKKRRLKCDVRPLPSVPVGD